MSVERRVKSEELLMKNGELRMENNANEKIFA